MNARLSDYNLEHAKRMRDAVRTHTPELVPFIRDLVELGMIDGWRNVRYCGPIPGGAQYRLAPSTIWNAK